MFGENKTPSVVRILPDDEKGVVGKVAKDGAGKFPEYTIQFIKSLIGKTDTYEYGSADDRHTTTPVGVSSEILKQLAADASEQTNTEVIGRIKNDSIYIYITKRSQTDRSELMHDHYFFGRRFCYGFKSDYR